MTGVQTCALPIWIGKKSEFYLELPEGEAFSADQATVVSPAPVVPSQAVALPPEPKPIVAPIVAPVVAPQPPKAAVIPAISGFASTYLMTPGAASPSRRRPGPSLSGFLDMAKQVKAS